MYWRVRHKSAWHVHKGNNHLLYFENKFKGRRGYCKRLRARFWTFSMMQKLRFWEFLIPGRERIWHFPQNVSLVTVFLILTLFETGGDTEREKCLVEALNVMGYSAKDV